MRRNNIIIGFLCCSLIHAIAQVPPSNSKVIHLNPSSSVQDDSTAYYDPSVATWTFNVTMRIPPKPASGKKIRFRFVLALPDLLRETDLKRHSECQNTRLFAGNCKERIQDTKYFYQQSGEYKEQIVVKFDHVYTGCYKLEIKCCTSPTSCDDCNRLKNWVYKHNLGHVETSLQMIDVSRTNISIRLSAQDSAAEVEFSVNYSTHLNVEQFQPFQLFYVEILHNNGKVKRNVTTSNRSRVSFPYCIDKAMNATCNAGDNDEQAINKTAGRCECLPDGVYTVTVHPQDSRCKVCGSIRHICKRYVFKNFTTPRRLAAVDKRTISGGFLDSSLCFTLTPLLALMICILLVSLVYLKRNQNRSRQQPDLQATKKETKALAGISNTCRVLLVYDSSDALVRIKAPMLRNQLIACGVSEVYDDGDPEQEENINIRGNINWFNGHISDPDVRIVVIQSQGIDRCQEELICNRIDASERDQKAESFLLFAMNQLISLASTNANNLYDRIFVTTYADLECTANNYLTPFRCFILPEHYSLLLVQLLMVVEK